MERVSNILKNFGAEIILTRVNDDYVSLQDRVNMANNNKVDLFISVHNNVSASQQNGKTIINPNVKGTEIYYSSSRPNIINLKYVEYEGNRYEYISEENIDGIDYVLIRVDNNEFRVEKNKVRIVDNIPYQVPESIDLAKMVLSGITSVGFVDKGVKIQIFM
ncbi:N-acetylmuramoyl-L-alanine amidase [Caloramator sp. mosi_1]|nr:N-acetylmuramoyl-L-alanine amidase [Caloramator sp. mosi_1]WDC85896.1 N-acetylmuramoyl-L-alanine amidase [Caloramator sp. mosi_1]